MCRRIHDFPFDRRECRLFSLSFSLLVFFSLMSVSNLFSSSFLLLILVYCLTFTLSLTHTHMETKEANTEEYIVEQNGA